jgi:HPt (histidine-containing phosphotransfer) domain-containing protein
MTANAMKEDRDRCLDAGMDDYLSKPIRARDVEATLLRWIHREHRDDVGAATAAGSPGTLPPIPAQRSSVAERLDDLAGDGTPAELELVRTIACSFLDRVPDLLSGLDDALARADGETGHLVAHSLKGAAANLGAERLAAACEQLEQLVEQARYQEAIAVRASLDAVLTEALAEIERYVTA